MHDDHLTIDLPLVRTLVDAAFPQYTELLLRPLTAAGSSNVLYRLGGDLLVRLPRQPGGSATIAKEATWLPYLADRVPVLTPEVIAIGEPGFGYPERWSIVRWIDGRVPSAISHHPAALAHDLADVILALRDVPVPAEAMTEPGLNWYRGRPLVDVDADIRAYLDQCRGLPDLDLDLAACQRIWDEAVALEAPVTGRRWLHGDLLAENLLLDDSGRLRAVLDFGALTVGDPTVDLIVAWEVLGRPARELFRSRVGVDETTWLRGRAWALAIAVMTFPYYWQTMPERCASRLVMARAVLADAEP